MKTTLTQSVQGALQGQVKPTEQLFMFPCTPTVASDHSIGAEATQVEVTVSLTCSAVAYISKALENRATALLTTQAQAKLAGYSLFGDIQVSVQQVTVTHTTSVFLSIKATGTWIYGLSRQSQEQIKKLVAGKSIDQAEKILSLLPGIAIGSIRFTGLTNDTKLPKDSRYIHIILIVQ